MKIYKFLSCILMMLFLITFSSAAGLVILNNSYTINKTVAIDYYTNITIQNNASFEFYNISFVNNPTVSINKISQLNPGESKVVQLKVFSDTDINSNFKLKGYYQANLGASNITKTINLNQDLGSSECVFSLIKGDSLLFKNIETSSYKKINLHYGDNNKLINPQEEFLLGPFSSPTILYFSSWLNDIYQLPLENPKNCEVTILDDVGLINNPDYDGILNLNLRTIHSPTNISYTITQTNFSLDFYSSSDGILSLTNLGPNVAKNVTLIGDWVTFSQNNFDIDVGLTKNIGYTVKPKVYTTNATNKNYNKNILITGNFDSKNISYNVFVKYAEINFDSSNSSQSIIDMITKICAENPALCNLEPKIIYRDINNSENLFNATLGEKQLKTLFSVWLDFMDEYQEYQNYEKQKAENDTIRLNTIENRTLQTSTSISNLEKSVETSNGVWVFLGLVISSIIVCFLIVFLIFHYTKKNKLSSFEES